MRPVQLVMDGFASFRHTSVIDFTGADYFALVGATGAGKSTVIDAITFALYGTVPRWNDQRVITPALAPTATRGVVRLIFDADGQRYAVAREARRSGGRTSRVSMHASRLERLHDPDDLDGGSDVLAADSEVSSAVESLLGLSYQHFTTCVALPQGEFAEFLHAKASDRQDILSSLLGHQVYDELQARANTRAREQRAVVAALDSTLIGYADATPEAVTELTGRADELDQLQAWVMGTGLPNLDQAALGVTGSGSRLAELTTQQEALAAVEVPTDVGSLDADLTAAATVRNTAARALHDAETADNDARGKIAAFRPRHQLLTLNQHWEELADIDTALPGIHQTVADADTAHAGANQATAAAEQLTEKLRLDADTAQDEAERADDAVTDAAQHAEALAKITIPLNIEELASGLTDLDVRRTELTAETDAADSAYTVAQEALAQIVPDDVLATGRRAAATIHDVLTSDLASWNDRAEAAADLAAVEAALADARTALADARTGLDAARLVDEAGALRAHLHPGQPCPVCEQPVTTVPAGHDTSHVADAQQMLDSAQDGYAAAERTHGDRDRSHRDTLAARTQSVRHVDTARAELHAAMQTLTASMAMPSTATKAGTAPTGRKAATRTEAGSLGSHTSDVATVLMSLAAPITPDTARDDLTRAADAADAARTVLDAAAARRREAQQALTTADSRRKDGAAARRTLDLDTAAIETQRRAAASVLQATRDTVIALGAPVVDSADLTAAWKTLTDWATSECATRTTRLPAQRKAAADAAKAATAARSKHTEHAEVLAELRRQQSAAASDLARFTQTLDATADRQKALRAALNGQPTAEEVVSLLTALGLLEHASTDRQAELTKARDLHTEARAALETLETRARGSWTRLSATRDPLTRYDAPPITADTLAAAWAQLDDWCRQQSTKVGRELTKARAAADLAAKKYQAAVAAVRDALIRHDVEPLDLSASLAQLNSAVVAHVAALVTSAHAAADTAAGQLRDRQRLEGERLVAAEQAHVAATLANLLRSDAFQAWLLESALASLVADASDILLEMSSGQFELRVRSKDIEVVDHNDADSTRPVRTLSGGETFQASLALALALSRQVSTLAASGAAKLESIFLDEGFGTLDETTLDVVAATLENLAASGERMVGVVTHVPALADRIPVRFQVTRTGANSRIERISA
jgi:exonuclease SbcC